MSDLEELIQYWRDALASLTIYLTPWTKQGIKRTIEALEELNKQKKGG